MPLYPKADIEALRRVLAKTTAKLDPLLAIRDGWDIRGDKRRAQETQARIDELIHQVTSDAGLDAIGKPLANAHKQGAISVNHTAAGRDARATFGDDLLGGSVTQALDKDSMRALARVVADPFAAAMESAKSPLPFIAPRLDVEKQRAVAEIVMDAKARGLSWDKTAKLIQRKLPETTRPIGAGLFAGSQVELEGGFKIQTDRYSHMLARTTGMWAANKGVIDQCDELELETVEIIEIPECVDYCLDMQGKVFALSEAAAAKFNVPLLSKCPNGGPPFHPNCRHSLAPIALTSKDKGGPGGNLETAPPDVLTGQLGRGKAGEAAQAAFAARLSQDALQYAKPIAEHAARAGFAGRLTLVQPGQGGKAIRNVVGKKEFLPPEGQLALSEDVHLDKHGGDLSRIEYRQKISDALRNASKDGDAQTVDKRNQIHFYDASQHFKVIVDAESGEVVTAHTYPPKRWARLKEKYDGRD